MFKRKLVTTALFGLLFVSPFAMAVDEHQPESAAEAAQEDPRGASVAPGSVMKPGMMSMTQGGGMMGKMMLGGQKGRGGMMQGSSGMMGHGGGMMSHGKKGGHDKGMMRKHQQIVNRLDMLDARMAKIEVMLERLMQR